MQFSEPFANGHTWIHALDARLRVLVAVAFSCTLAVAARVPQAASGLAAAVLLLAASRPPIRALLHRLFVVNIFLVFLWLTVPFSMPGTLVWQYGLLTASREGLMLMALLTLKANAITCMALACIATMRIPCFGHTLCALHVPEKFVFLLLFTYRGIFLLAEEWRLLHIALKIRCFVPRASLHSYRTLGNLLGLTLVKSVDRAGRIQQAMLLRGFTGRFISLAEFDWTGRDTAFLALMGLLFALYFFFL